MRYLPTKKSLKQGIPQNIASRFCVHEMNQWCKEYGCTIEEAFKLWIETKDAYIDIYFNYGYAITSLKVAEIDDDGIGEYRCRATIEKL